MNRSLICLTLILVSLSQNIRAQRTSPPDDGGLRTLPGSSDEVEPSTGPRRIRQVEVLLNKGDFDHLDEIAQKLRLDKSRNRGGGWRLRTFYGELNPTETDEAILSQRRQQFEAWMKQKPESITPRVALAEFYTNYAWVARGNSDSDKVQEKAWPVFLLRAAMAETVLKEAGKLAEKCPEYYAAMQTVALASGWSKQRAKALFEEAVKFEPDYPYFYEHYATYLLPKWYGNDHDAIDFAKASADALGAERGDIIYFDVATVLIKKGNGSYRPDLDWQRIQRGHAALETAYGTSSTEQNHFAFMAVRFHDQATAQKEFAAIGEKWSRNVWRTRGAFDKARDWSVAKVPAGLDAG